MTSRWTVPLIPAAYSCAESGSRALPPAAARRRLHGHYHQVGVNPPVPTRGLEAKGYNHEITKIKRNEKLAHQLMPPVHRVAALLKRWILGPHQGSVSNKHLDYYLDEFTFHFNRRHSRACGVLFDR